MSYIKLEDLQKIPIRIDHYDEEHGNINFVLGIETAIEYAESLPKADVVEVRHGEWKINDNGGYVCSECDCWLEDYYGATPQMMLYCFHCGAKMDSTVC